MNITTESNDYSSIHPRADGSVNEKPRERTGVKLNLRSCANHLLYIFKMISLRVSEHDLIAVLRQISHRLHVALRKVRIRKLKQQNARTHHAQRGESVQPFYSVAHQHLCSEYYLGHIGRQAWAQILVSLVTTRKKALDAMTRRIKVRRSYNATDTCRGGRGKLENRGINRVRAVICARQNVGVKINNITFGIHRALLRVFSVVFAVFAISVIL